MKIIKLLIDDEKEYLVDDFQFSFSSNILQ